MNKPKRPLSERLEGCAQAMRAAHLLSCEATCREASQLTASLPSAEGARLPSSDDIGIYIIPNGERWAIAGPVARDIERRLQSHEFFAQYPIETRMKNTTGLYKYQRDNRGKRRKLPATSKPYKLVPVEKYEYEKARSRSTTPQRKWYCENADDYNIPACSKQCEKCWRADNTEKIEAAAFRENMERECKP